MQIALHNNDLAWEVDVAEVGMHREEYTEHSLGYSLHCSYDDSRIRGLAQFGSKGAIVLADMAGYKNRVTILDKLTRWEAGLGCIVVVEVGVAEVVAVVVAVVVAHWAPSMTFPGVVSVSGLVGHLERDQVEEILDKRK